ncbi:SANT/Myb-like DNA-binding domain-containing protein [Caballeronia sp. LZ043]|uniref:SANT/Myb-like DNA-binding domain-containing protein n=1 Tax=Caballeronia sp. LZ043 TaxID=3038569 RepID=UPI00285EEE80|nr:SANT/Myb-like DNA-binding domain-containing protein [Caballeronia sp. LZ043]MDR5825851.1 SANT/Myb-like DNA-binding domain-containing protein [Caballeronia sp. LZ043]
MKRDWRAWTPEEDALLREIWKKPGALKWSGDLFPGRTVNAIRFRGHVGLKLPRRAALRASTYSWCEEVVDAALKAGFVGTVFQIAEVTPASHQRIRQIVRAKEGEKYYIAGWEKRTNGCDWTPKWAWGDEPSVPKPACQTRSQISKRYRARAKLKLGQFNPFATLAQQVVA